LGDVVAVEASWDASNWTPEISVAHSGSSLLSQPGVGVAVGAPGSVGSIVSVGLGVGDGVSVGEGDGVSLGFAVGVAIGVGVGVLLGGGVGVTPTTH
jgi:hypothetical protein